MILDKYGIGMNSQSVEFNVCRIYYRIKTDLLWLYYLLVLLYIDVSFLVN